LNVKQPYRDYQYKILQRILLFDFNSEDHLTLKKMKEFILSDKLFSSIHSNLFLLYYSIRMLETLKKYNLEREAKDLYLKRLLKLPIDGYLSAFNYKAEINKDFLTEKEFKTQSKFIEDLKMLLLKHFEVLYLPQTKLKIDSYR
jgi:hypothetical protein